VEQLSSLNANFSYPSNTLANSFQLIFVDTGTFLYTNIKLAFGCGISAPVLPVKGCQSSEEELWSARSLNYREENVEI
jgi:hypothetical protein